MTSDHLDTEIARTSAQLDALRAQYAKANRDFDDFKTMQLKDAIAAATVRLSILQQKKDGMSESLRSSGAVFYGSDH